MAHAKSASPNDFILPDLGEGVHEAELIKWRVAVGDTVKEHDILAEMETDKALVEVPSPRDGTIAALHGKEGEILHVGNPLVSYEGAGGAAAPAVEAKPAKQAASPTPAAKQPSQNGSSHHDEEVPEPSAEREDAGTVVGQMGGSLGGVTAAPGKALATPAVRRLARDLGIDINTVAGTGLAGRVTEKDVRAAATGSGGGASRGVSPRPETTPGSRGGSCGTFQPSLREAPAASSPSIPRREVSSFAPGEATTRIPFRGVRRTIASRLRESVDQAVHFTVMDEADVSLLDGLRKKLAAASGEKVSFLPFVASAVCRVLTDERFRALNATVDEKPTDANYEAGIVQHRAVHLGVATDTETGLMVPVIRDCDALGVLEIGREITGIAKSARDRSIPREKLVGSTFTISNVGSHAGRFATPVINYPEVAIIAVGRARPAPVVRTVGGFGEGGAAGVFAGNVLPLSLACDHRVVDGATAALALAEIIALLQNPEQLLTPARG